VNAKLCVGSAELLLPWAIRFRGSAFLWPSDALTQCVVRGCALTLVLARSGPPNSEVHLTSLT
jgi:hypothetical protein